MDDRNQTWRHAGALATIAVLCVLFWAVIILLFVA